MTAKTCPYLGLLNDAETMAAFPSHKNYCHHADPVEAVNMDHQLIYCLQPEHKHCQVLRKGVAAPLPAGIKAFPRNRIALPLTWRSVLLAALVLLIAAGALWLQSGGASGFSWRPDQSPIQPASLSGALPSSTSVFSQPSSTARLTASPQNTATRAPTSTLAPAETACPYPEGWLAVALLPDMSLENLAEAYGTRPEVLMQANCLDELPMESGSLLFVPSLPTATAASVPVDGQTEANEPSPTVCSPSRSWAPYIVRAGDTLQKIASFYKISVKDLQQANCMGRSTLIYAGGRLLVPYAYPVQPELPQATSTPAPLPTDMSQPPAPPANTPTVAPSNSESTPTVVPPP
jgi:LysM repeat protein